MRREGQGVLGGRGKGRKEGGAKGRVNRSFSLSGCFSSHFQNMVVEGEQVRAFVERPAPGQTRVRCWVNGELRQDGPTENMIFDIPTLIETISRGITLYPGDIIATGTPAGVGMGLNPPRYIAKGDVIRVEIDGVGHIENRFV